MALIKSLHAGEPAGVINHPAFLHPGVTRLAVHDRLWSLKEGRGVESVPDGSPYMTISCPAGHCRLSDKVVFLTPAGQVPICNLQRATLRLGREFTLYSGGGSERPVAHLAKMSRGGKGAGAGGKKLKFGVTKVGKVAPFIIIKGCKLVRSV